MPNERHLKEVGIDFNRDLNPELYDRMFGDYVPLPMNKYRVEAPPYSATEPRTELSPFSGEGAMIPFSEDEIDMLNAERNSQFDPHAKERKLMDVVETVASLYPTGLATMGSGAAMNQAKNAPTMARGLVRLSDWASGRFNRMPQYVAVSGTSTRVRPSLVEGAAAAKKAGYTIGPESTVGKFTKRTLKDGNKRIQEYAPTGEWINMRKPGWQTR